MSVGAVLTGLAVGAAAGAAWASAPRQSPVALKDAPDDAGFAVGSASASTADCNGGAPGLLSVSLTDAPTAVRAGSLHLELQASHRLEGARTALGYVAEVLDPHQRPVTSDSIAPAQRLPASQALRAAVAFPTDLADGYYLARVTAAVSDGSLVESSYAQLPFAVSAGAVRRVSQDEFDEHSGSERSLGREGGRL